MRTGPLAQQPPVTSFNYTDNLSEDSETRPELQKIAMESSNDSVLSKAITSGPLLTPLNSLLLALIITIIYLQLRPSEAQKLPAPEPPIVFKTYTPRTLLEFNGANGKPVRFGVRGRVFDVTAGRHFYGPGGPYENFAGRDATRGLAKGSFDEDMLTKDLDGPLDKLGDLSPDEWEALKGWEETFEGKYLVVGRLVAAGDESKASK